MRDLGLIDPELQERPHTQPETEPSNSCEHLAAAESVEQRIVRLFPNQPDAQRINTGLYLGLAARYSRYDLEKTGEPLKSRIYLLEEDYAYPYLGFMEKLSKYADEETQSNSFNPLDVFYENIMLIRLYVNQHRENVEEIIHETGDFLAYGLSAAKANILDEERVTDPVLAEFNCTLRLAGDSLFLGVADQYLSRDEHLADEEFYPQLAEEYSDTIYWTNRRSLLKIQQRHRNLGRWIRWLGQEHKHWRHLNNTPEESAQT